MSILQITLEEKPEAAGAQEAKEPLPRRKMPVRQPLLKNVAEVERITARFKHLCWLIQQDRRPYCPINGVLMTIPFSATANEGDSNQIGLICRQDLACIRDVLEIHCPVFALICDVEKTAGFREFIDRFPKGHRQRRLGQQFPYTPDLTPEETTTLVESGVRWICLDLFPPLVYRLMRLEKPSGDKLPAVLRGNMRLYLLMWHMRERWKRLCRVLSLALTRETHGPVLFGGCYIAGTGRSASREQAFIAAVFHRLLESQNYVSWTAEGEAEEMDYRRWTVYGYSALAVFVLSVFVLGYFFTFRS